MSGPSNLVAPARHPVLLPTPGQRLYIPDLYCPDHFARWVHGGRATISQVTRVATVEGAVTLIKVEKYEQEWLCFDVLQRAQWELGLQYGDQEMVWDPDACFRGDWDYRWADISTRCLWSYDPRSLLPPTEEPQEPWQPS